MFDLKGKTALVTGSGQGIGKSTALLLATHGAKVIINWRSRDEIAMETLKELDEMGADYITWKYDLSSATIREDFEAWAKENAISVDILVLNASVQVSTIGKTSRLRSLTFRCIQMYARHLLLFRHAFLPCVRRNGAALSQ